VILTGANDELVNVRMHCTSEGSLVCIGVCMRCVYVCMHACMCVCVCVCVCVCNMYACMHTYVCIYARMKCTRTCAFTHVCTHPCIHTCTLRKKENNACSLKKNIHPYMDPYKRRCVSGRFFFLTVVLQSRRCPRRRT